MNAFLGSLALSSRVKPANDKGKDLTIPVLNQKFLGRRNTGNFFVVKGYTLSTLNSK